MGEESKATRTYTDRYKKLISKHLDRVESGAKNGKSKRDLAREFNVSESAYFGYEVSYPELREAYDRGTEHLLDDIEGSLYKAARGHKVAETWLDEKGEVTKQFVKELPPNQRSIEYTLNNRRPDKWRSDTKTIDISLSEKMRDKLGNMTFDELQALSRAKVIEDKED